MQNASPHPTTYRPGDVLFFSGSDWGSRAIQLVTLRTRVFVAALVCLLLPLGNNWNPWPVHPWASTGAAICCWGLGYARSPKISHVGIIAPENGANWIIESTTLCTKPCGILGREVRGVQAHNPEGWRIKQYNGKVWLLRLNEDRELTELETSDLGRMVMRKLGKPYSMLGAAISGSNFVKWFWLPRASAHGFCSQVVAYWLKSLGRFPDDVHSASVHPNMLWRILLEGENFEDEARRVK